MRPGALGSLQRGVLNLRANRELIAAIWLQRALVLLLTVASALPFYLVLEVRLPDGRSTPDEYLAWLVGMSERLLEQATTVPFWMAVIASAAVATLALFVYSFFQAGAFGILTAGDRSGSTGGELPVASFRSFSWTEFQAGGGRHLWRFFWLFNLMLLLWTVWLLLVLLAALVSGLTVGGAGIGAGLALGCLAVLPLAFVAVLLIFWSVLAQAEVAALDCGVWAGLLGGLRLATRRLGTVLALAVALVVVVAGAAIVFLLLTLTLHSALAAFDAARVTLSWLLQAVQWLVGGVIDLVFAAAIVALARAEHALIEKREVTA